MSEEKKAEKKATLFDRVKKVLGPLTTDGTVKVHGFNASGSEQDHWLDLETVVNRFETAPDAVNGIGLTNKETLKRAIEYLLEPRTSQAYGFLLSGYTGMNVPVKVEPDGYSLNPYGNDFSEVTKELIDHVDMTDNRGRKKGTEKKVTEI